MRRSFPLCVLSHLAATACLLSAIAVVGPSAEAVPATAASDRQVHLDRFAPGAWKQAGTRRKHSRTYAAARWKSRWTTPGMDFTELIASWSARTPGSSWIEVEVRGRSAAGARTSWDTLARWAAKDKVVRRRSGGPQTDDGTRVATDTWRTAGLASYRIRVTTYREPGRKAPRVDLATVMTSRLPAAVGPVSAPGVAHDVELAVPRYSQMVHNGHYPQWGGGGEAWCSPTSTSMVLGYFGRLPGAGSYRWVPAGHRDPWVDAAARATYDHAYDGTGNWPFNTAFAARRLGPAGEAFVTRLRDLTDAELLVAAGIPPVVSIAFTAGELGGAPISASNGHLLVIVGFTATGDVIVNDPAAADAAGVRRVYARAQLERIWLRASGGMAYVVHDAAHPLPAAPGGNW
ncbi:peptidase C39 family protein [Nocardioides albidus]|uniref:Peptidase C39 family protein n=1 Tax=Nocardioides albidus TaxID=1517589 RepID=A0A5C4VL60_9ACTN|nr:peptidase C39 family protein [Nocardioides albidus]TNM36564.1 peptidase C39 family protein [Nocardioides albidus]